MHLRCCIFCTLQNEAVDSKDANYLASCVKKGKKSSRPYSCTSRKKPASKVVLKRPGFKPRAADVQCKYEKHRMCVCLHARVKLVISKSSKHRLLKFFVSFKPTAAKTVYRTDAAATWVNAYIYIYTHTYVRMCTKCSHA